MNQEQHSSPTTNPYFFILQSEFSIGHCLRSRISYLVLSISSTWYLPARRGGYLVHCTPQKILEINLILTYPFSKLLQVYISKVQVGHKAHQILAKLYAFDAFAA